jgi:hypothetical protein
LKYRPKTKPFRHQSKAVIRAVKHRNYAIFFEPRLGKSKVALDVAGVWALKGRVKRVLIVAPRIAIEVWEKEIERHFPYWYDAEDFESSWQSTTRIFAGPVCPEVKFFLASREELWALTKPAMKKLREVEKWAPDLIVLDESHEYKRPGGRGAQRAWRFVGRLRRKRKDNGLPYVLLLSGTPNPKGWVDLFAQFRIMDEGIFGTDAASFKDEYVVYGKGRQKWKVIRYNNVKQLEKKVRAHSYAVSADEAGLANKVFMQALKVKMPSHAIKMYLELVEEFITEWEGGVIDAANAGVKRIRLLQLVGGFTTEGQQIHDAKVRTLRDQLRLLVGQGESVVVYCRFTPEVAAAYRVADEVAPLAFRVDGQTKRHDRSKAIAALREIPEEPTVVVFQYQAGSRAIELVGAAETVYYSTPDGWVDYFQTMKRTQGPNQKRPVRYTHLVVPGTVDVSTIRGLKEKEDWHSSLMRNPRRYLLPL